MLPEHELVLLPREVVLRQREVVLQQQEVVLQQWEVVLQQREVVLQQRSIMKNLIYGPKNVSQLQSDSFGIFILSHPPKLRSAKQLIVTWQPLVGIIS